MNERKMICFDMDGTIADLYGVNGWLEMLENEDTTPYIGAKPMWDMVELNTVLMDLQAEGWIISVVTWLAMNSTEEYKKATREIIQPSACKSIKTVLSSTISHIGLAPI